MVLMDAVKDYAGSTAWNILNQIYIKAADETAVRKRVEKVMEKFGNEREKCIDYLIKRTILKEGVIGFLSGMPGGLASVPAITGDLAILFFNEIRLAAEVALLRGHRLNCEETKMKILAVVSGVKNVDELDHNHIGMGVNEKVLEKTVIKKGGKYAITESIVKIETEFVSREGAVVAGRVLEREGLGMATKIVERESVAVTEAILKKEVAYASREALIKLDTRAVFRFLENVPVLGGVIGMFLDVISTRKVGKKAKKVFILQSY